MCSIADIFFYSLALKFIFFFYQTYFSAMVPLFSALKHETPIFQMIFAERLSKILKIFLGFFSRVDMVVLAMLKHEKHESPCLDMLKGRWKSTTSGCIINNLKEVADLKFVLQNSNNFLNFGERISEWLDSKPDELFDKLMFI